jgi:ABC-2 type transport system permease protein
MMKWLNWFEKRFWTLTIKEFRQTLRDRRLIFLLVALPIIQLLSYGFALNPDVRHLELGVVDYAKTNASHELISALTENQLFTLTYSSDSEKKLSQQIENAKITVGIVIPPDFERYLNRGSTAQVQVLIDGVNANTAGLARSYIAQIVRHYNQQTNPDSKPAQVSPQVIYLYNPGLVSSWFFVSGIMGIILTLVGSIVSAAAMVREKELGTIEQLLMTPSADREILLAKVVPLLILLLNDVLLILIFSRFVFDLPLRSNLLVCLAVSGIYILGIIEMGILIGTIFQNQQQTQLVAFSLNVPLGLLCGAITPVESMPLFFQYLSWLNPLRHYVILLRGLLLKGVGLDVLWLHALIVCAFTAILFTISINRFRHQFRI